MRTAQTLAPASPWARRLRACHLALCILLALSMGTSCGEVRTLVVVSVSGIAPEVTSLQVTATLNEQSAQPEVFAVNGASSLQVGLRLPPSSSGAYALTVSGRNLDGCVIYRGTAAAQLSGEYRTDLAVPLMPLLLKDCGGPAQTLTVVRAGAGGGTVSATPAILSCGTTCTADVPKGSQLTLSVRADNTSRFLGWSGACSGTAGTCNVTVDAATQVTATFGPLVCSSGKFCWENPLPRGYAILRVFGISTNNVWAATENGILLRYNGTSWSEVPSGLTIPILGIWGSASDDVWAVGANDFVQHWNGTSWSQMPLGFTGRMSAVWGTAANNVWFVGQNGVIARWNGTQFTQVTSNTLNTLTSVWGTSPSDVWAVGAAGTILHYNGTAWSAFTSNTTNYLTGVYATAANDAWAVGDKGTVRQWNGTAWLTRASGTTLTLNAVWSYSASDVWIVGDADTIVPTNLGNPSQAHLA